MENLFPIKKEKEVLRKYFLEILKTMPVFRKEQTEKLLLNFFSKYLPPHSSVLSFFSLPSEINTSLLNLYLVQHHSLFLPDFHHKGSIFYVDSKKTLSTLKSTKDSLTCRKIFYPKIILVPALAFSVKTKHRLGRGSGWYDLYLSSLPKESISIGIGFQEQRCQRIPKEKHDISLKKLFLF